MYSESAVLVKGKINYVAVRRQYQDKIVYGVFTDQEDFSDRNASNNRFGFRELKQMVLAAYPELEGKSLEYRGGWLLLKHT